LRAAGHDVVTATEAGLRNVRDADVFAAAIADNRIVLTNNCKDFVELHEERMRQNQPHPGLFFVFLQNNPNGDMSYDEIVKAIANLEATPLQLISNCHTMNSYNY
jgi:hypothetical protein